METSELLKKVRRIEIKTRGLSRNIFAGQYHSAFKGRGMAFSEVREYQYGDDIRDIDWNVTARYVRPYVKVFEEERELTVMLLIDVSGSRDFGSVNVMKKEVITEIAATLAFSAIQNNDKIGVVFFSEVYPAPERKETYPLYYPGADRFPSRGDKNGYQPSVEILDQRHQEALHGFPYLRFYRQGGFQGRLDGGQPQA